MTLINLAIADDHPIVVNGLCNLLINYPQFKIAATYESGAELLTGLGTQLPDVLLLDIHFPDTTGNQLIRIISKQYPDLKVLVLSSTDSPYDIKDMMQHGCLGYVLKNTPLKTLVEAIETVYTGTQFLNEEVKEQLFQAMLQQKPMRPINFKLTQREQIILNLLYEGKTNHEISNELFVSERTIQNNRLSLYRKLSVRNTVELIKSALSQGLIQP